MEVKRGDVVVIAMQGNYGKPRPAVVVQADGFHESHASIVMCPMTSSQETSMFRLLIEPSHGSGLKHSSCIMIDKITAVPKDKVGKIIGRLSGSDLVRIDTSLRLLLDLL